MCRKIICTVTFVFVTVLMYSQCRVGFLYDEFINDDVRRSWTIDELTYFVASDGVHGQELWVTDLTEEGTTLVKDIFPGIVGANPIFVAELQGKVVFEAVDDSHGREYWISDGTHEGTILLKDIAMGTDSSVISHQSIVYNDLLYFAAFDDIHGTELWVSDGTQNGTQLLKDINPGEASANPQLFYEFAGDLYFFAENGTVGQEMWRTDGTEDGTVLFKDLNTGPSSCSTTSIGATSTRMYFNSYSSVGRELWSSDGTPEGTSLVKDIFPDGFSSDPFGFTAFKDEIYFSARGGLTEGRELWKSDGTETGTVLLFDLQEEFHDGSDPGDFILFQDRLYFTALVQGYHNRVLMSMDSSAQYLEIVSEDRRIQDVQLFDDALYYSALVPYGISAIFRCSHFDVACAQVESHDVDMRILGQNGDQLLYNVGGELWISDGGNQEAEPLMKLNQVRVGDAIRSKFCFNDGLFLKAGRTSPPADMWVTDGSPENTKRFPDAEPEGHLKLDDGPIAINEVFFFSGYDPEIGTELWKSDGTSEGTVLFKEFRSGTGSGFIRFVANTTEKFYFLAYAEDEQSSMLWVSDGTDSGTRPLKNLYPIETYNSTSPAFLEFGNSVLFVAKDTTNEFQIWKSDGTVSGTFPITTTFDGGGLGYNSLKASVGEYFYFSVSLGGMTSELWRSDGTIDGMARVASNEGAQFGAVISAFDLNDEWYFADYDPISYYRLWKTDGTDEGTVLITSEPKTIREPFIGYGDKFFFSGSSEGSGRELWSTDGTALGTTLVKDISPGIASSAPTDFIKYDSLLFFLADDGVHGQEVWVSDGTEAGTHLHMDIFPGVTGQRYFRGSRFVVCGDALFFQGRTHESYDELLVISEGCENLQTEDAVVRPQGLRLKVFPNPLQGELTLEINSDRPLHHARICIYDVMGKLIHKESAQNHGSALSRTIFLGDISKGLYFIEVNIDGQILSTTFIK